MHLYISVCWWRNARWRICSKRRFRIFRKRLFEHVCWTKALKKMVVMMTSNLGIKHGKIKIYCQFIIFMIFMLVSNSQRKLRARIHPLIFGVITNWYIFKRFSAQFVATHVLTHFWILYFAKCGQKRILAEKSQS